MASLGSSLAFVMLNICLSVPIYVTHVSKYGEGVVMNRFVKGKSVAKGRGKGDVEMSVR